MEYINIKSLPSPSLLNPLEEEDEPEGFAFSSNIPHEGHSAEVVDLLHLWQSTMVSTRVWTESIILNSKSVNTVHIGYHDTSLVKIIFFGVPKWAPVYRIDLSS